MENDCYLLNSCPFFKKYQPTKDLVCKGFIALYCKGPKRDKCKRLEYRTKFGIPPSEDMMPTGQFMST